MVNADIDDIVSEASFMCVYYYIVESDGNYQKHDTKFGWQGWQKQTYALLPSYALCHPVQMSLLRMYTVHTTRP